MKKGVLLILFIAALWSCTKVTDEISAGFVADLSAGRTIKSSFDGDGSGQFADRCKMQIWLNETLIYQETVPVVNYKAKFSSIILSRGEEYDFLFWADNTEGNYYNTETLKAVRFSRPYIGCDDKRDAFSASVTGKTVEEALKEEIILTRPFAQLNLITTDIYSLLTQLPDSAKFKEIVPEKVQLELNAPTIFNVKTGEASEYKPFAYEAPIYTAYNKKEGAKSTLAMDYIYAPAGEGYLTDVVFTGTKFTNIPLVRNKRTNVIGSLLTVNGSWEVDVIPDWDGFLTSL